MKYFSAIEFKGFYPLMDERLLVLLDRFRELWGHPVKISPAIGAVGRVSGNSYHNYVLHKKVMAVDVMPLIAQNGRARSCTAAELRQAFEVAKRAGFTGVGIYHEWLPHPGLHLDVRPSKDGYVATWAGVKDDEGKQVYVGAGSVA